MNYEIAGTMIYCRIQLFVLLTLMMFYRQVCPFTGCQISTLTEKYVDQCPTDAESWKMAAKQKNCESIEQECTQLNELNSQRYIFQYHCLLNSWGNATIEVCALNRSIFGYCAEYDADGGLVQDNYDLECQQRRPPCPALYNSAEAYQYQYCYNMVYRKRAKKITATQKGSSSSCERLSGSCLLILQSIALALRKPYG